MAAIFSGLVALFVLVLSVRCAALAQAPQQPLTQPADNGSISSELFLGLEELARLVDIAYCVGTAGLGIQKPFQCASRCAEFDDFELVTAWNTGPLLSDSCGYVALSHPPAPPRIIVAFRGTYSVANTIIDLSTMPQEYVPYPGDDSEPSDFLDPSLEPERPAEPQPQQPPKCEGCTVHTGFYTSWLNTRRLIMPVLADAVSRHPDYNVTLVGHSLGGAVAALAGLDLVARGWDPRVTTFGEPRIGNAALAAYLNARFDISPSHPSSNKFRRITHVDDPVPQLPLAEWDFATHSEEIFISKRELPPAKEDVHHCEGDEDPSCLAGNDDEMPKWAIPARFRLWQLFFAHRDYFWRLGLCVPGGDPTSARDDDVDDGASEL